jgi:hypothetical protein
MQFTVKDVRVFDELAPPEMRDVYIRSVARREVTRFFQTLRLDEVLGGDRAAVSARLRERVQAALDRLNPDASGTPRGAGIQIAYLAITGAHPPKETAPAFETPVQAFQRQDANVTSARTEAVRRLTEVVGDAGLADRIVQEISTYDTISDRVKDAPAAQRAEFQKQLSEQELRITTLLQSAGGSAASALSQARADRWRKHMTARRNAVRYRGQLAVYEAAPEVFELSLYFDALRDIMKQSRLYIVPDMPGLRIDMDLKERDMGVDLFRTKDDIH